MKCPICQNNLYKINTVVSTCTNDKCKLWGSSIPNLVLEALADTNKKLDEAIDLLKMLYGDYNLDWSVVDSDKVYYFLKQINQKDVK